MTDVTTEVVPQEPLPPRAPGELPLPRAVFVGDREEVLQVVGQMLADRVGVSPADVAPSRAVFFKPGDVRDDVDSSGLPAEVERCDTATSLALCG